MLNEAKLPNIYWREEVYTTIYILNRAQLRVNHDKTPYELWFGRPTSVKHFRVFGRKCYIKRDDDNLGKFDSRSNEGIFLGYSFIPSSFLPIFLIVHATICTCTWSCCKEVGCHAHG
jgi:hypothetical protein